jgi:hypothetical protein
MKKLLLLGLLALPFAVSAQTTNVNIRAQVNGVNAIVNLDATGNKKDQNRIAGVVYAYGVYTNSLAVGETPLAMEVWLRGKFIALVDDYASQRQASDNAATAAKINTLLTQQSDLLSNAQLAQLAAIAALLP